MITALVTYNTKTFNDMELWKLCLAGGKTIVNFNKKTNQKHHGYIFDKAHGLH